MKKCILISFWIFEIRNIAFIFPSHFIIVQYFTLWMLDFFNTIRVSNSLDPDQAQHFVAPDLGKNCLQRLSSVSARPEFLGVIADPLFENLGVIGKFRGSELF